MENSLRNQAQDHHRFVSGLITENEQLRRKVELLERQVEVYKKAGGQADPKAQRELWLEALQAIKTWGSLDVGSGRRGPFAWDSRREFPMIDGMQGLLLELCSEVDLMPGMPGPGLRGRVHWKKTAADWFRRHLDTALADQLDALTEGLKANNRLRLTIELAFLIWKEEAPAKLTNDPAGVLDRLREELGRIYRTVRQHRTERFNQTFGGGGPRRPSGTSKADARATLGVGPDADQEAIKAAYRAAARRTHPDTPGGNAEAFRRVAEAYQALTA